MHRQIEFRFSRLRYLGILFSIVPSWMALCAILFFSEGMEFRPDEYGIMLVVLLVAIVPTLFFHFFLPHRLLVSAKGVELKYRFRRSQYLPKNEIKRFCKVGQTSYAFRKFPESYYFVLKSGKKVEISTELESTSSNIDLGFVQAVERLAGLTLKEMKYVP